MMFFFAEKSPEGIWEIFADYGRVGGTVIRICRAVDETVARQTASAMNVDLAK